MESVLGPNLRFCHPPSPSDHSCALPLRSKPVYLTSRLLPIRLLPIRLLRTVRPSSYFIVAASSSSPMADSTRPAQASKPFSVLFVCLGNICRSPAAEAVFRDVVRKRGLDSSFKIDSAGTIGYHEGDPADPRMRAAAKSRGIEVTSISRPVRPSDFRDFDLILAMDLQNKDDLMSSLERWKHKEVHPEDAYKKVKLMCSYCRKHSEIEVPDPYYGGPQGFEKVLDLLEDACEVLLDNILAENRHISLS